MSDARVKEDIEPIGMLYDQTPVYSYRYIKEIDPTGKKHIGVMAQDVQKNTPHAVIEVGHQDGQLRCSYRAIALSRDALRDGWVDGPDIIPKYIRLTKSRITIGPDTNGLESISAARSIRSGAGMPMNILPQAAQQTGNSSYGDMSNFLLKLAQGVQQNNQGPQVPPLQMPQPNYGMLSGILGKMV